MVLLFPDDRVVLFGIRDRNANPSFQMSSFCGLFLNNSNGVGLNALREGWHDKLSVHPVRRVSGLQIPFQSQQRTEVTYGFKIVSL